MSPQPFRLSSGGQIDREKPLSFTFNGKTYRGFLGDTLASALLANGVHLVARGFKYHRPRGILAAGAEEPNALIQLETGKHTQPNLRATQIELYDGLTATSVNAWPSVRYDIGAINNVLGRLIPSGFYYKTFMWPRRAWPFYETFIRQAAGLGKAPDAPDPDTYDRVNTHCDILIVGGGPAGLAAAKAASATGARVILVEQDANLGGQLLGTTREIDSAPALYWVAQTIKDLAAAPELRILTRTTLTSYFDQNFLIACESVTDHLGPGGSRPDKPRLRLWRIRAKQVILATGALERPIAFKNNDRPGIMLANAVETYINRYAVKPGRRAVVFTNNDSAYSAAQALADAGVGVTSIDPRPQAGPLAQASSVTQHFESHVQTAQGGKHVTGITVTHANGGSQNIACDLVAVSGGWNPAVHLFSQSRGKLAFDEGAAAFIPDRAAQPVRNAGACNGSFALIDCLEEGTEAGAAAAADAGFKPAPAATTSHRTDDKSPAPLTPLWSVPTANGAADERKYFLDFQNDVTVADVRLAAREGYRSVEHLKRYTTLGMGTDQGKLANVAGLAILAEQRGAPIEAVGTTTFRPPYTPLSFGAMAGRDVGSLLDPIRRTPVHAWHEQQGAVFEDVGQWKRPFYYPRPGEDKQAAVTRECTAARHALGLADASTLGKIHLQGPDVATFLNRIYTNAWSKLAVGRCRYGLMLDENGMVMDDGITARLAENSYLMTTTSGNAARVWHWLENWLQTEWPELKVFPTPATEQFPPPPPCGPKARDLLAELTSDIDLSPDAFPFMQWRAGTVAGIPARVFRISFTGELSYEINVPASHGMALWTALMTAGAKYGITPYGTEAMHVLRAEKGYIIVGQETDGTVTPYDLGMDWIVSQTKGDFIGARSLTRADTTRTDRKQLVGLLTNDPQQFLPEGGQIVSVVKPKPPMDMIGHVTSSYWSPALNRSIAFALIKSGRNRLGTKIYVPPERGEPIAATVTDTAFFDPEGTRLHG